MFSLARLPERNLSLLGDVDSLFNDLISATRGGELDRMFVPALDIVETADGYEVRADLPGIRKEDLSVQIKDSTLIIEAESRSESEEKEGDTVLKSERRIGKYYRALRLGEAVDESGIRAEYNDGVLTLALPRSVKVEGKKIDVDIH